MGNQDKTYDNALEELVEELLEFVATKAVEKIATAIDDKNEVPIQFPGGCYYGERRRGVPNGQGKIVAKDGAFYEGTFIDGQMIDGYAEYSTSIGQSWKGRFQNNKIAAPGKFTLPDGSIWEGIKGEFIDIGGGAVFTGEGKIVDTDGTVYEGEIVEWQPNGLGRITLSNGHRYEGEFKDWKSHGHGIYYGSDGVKYEGEFVEGLPVNCVYTNKSGYCYKGQFDGWQANGKGEIEYANGTKYEGEVGKWQPNGRGKMIYSDGRISEGLFKDGVLVKQ